MKVVSRCVYCHGELPINYTAKEYINLTVCCAPDGDGHLFVEVEVYEDGEECSRYCWNRISHPCERCGRVGARGKAYIRMIGNLWQNED
jgi:hypothetical protein